MTQHNAVQSPITSTDHVQALGSISLKTNEAVFYQNLKFIFADSTKVLAELIQNARRAGASKVSLTFDEQTKILVVEDDGCGIQDFQTLIHNSQSGWDDAVQKADACFGIGFLSVLFAADEIIVESRGRKCLLVSEQVIAMEKMSVFPSDYIGPTRITLVNFKLSLKDAEKALKKYARGFAIPVCFNGIVLDRDHALDQLAECQTLSIGTAKLNSATLTDTVFYVQGLPIENPLCSYSKNNDAFRNVVHLDSTFDVKMPDRHALYNADIQALRIIESMSAGWIEKLHTLKANLPAEEFSSYFETLRCFKQLALLNDVPFLPKNIVHRMNDAPTQIEDYRFHRDEIPLISQDDINNGLHTVLYNLDTHISEHQGLSMAIQTVIFELGWFYIENSPLDKGHWLYQSKAINLDTATMTLEPVTKVSSYFSGNYVYADIHIVDHLSLYLNGEQYVIKNPSLAIEHDSNSADITLYLSSESNVGTALGQASSYTNEHDEFQETDFESDVNALTNVRAQLLGELPSVSLYKAAQLTGLIAAPNCLNSASVLTINDKQQMKSASLQDVLSQFAEHQKLVLDPSIINEFVAQLFKQFETLDNAQ